MPNETEAPLTPEQQKICDALDQLNRSERGHRAAVRLRKFIEADEGSAISLDTNNWRALEDLVRGCRVFGAHNIRNLLPRR